MPDARHSRAEKVAAARGASRIRERNEVDLRRLLAVALVVVAVLAACAIGVARLESWLTLRYGRDTRAVTPAGLPAMDGAALQVDAPAELAAYLRDQRALLSKYRWVDRPHGIAAIPIDEAMALVAVRAASKVAP